MHLRHGTTLLSTLGRGPVLLSKNDDEQLCSLKIVIATFYCYKFLIKIWKLMNLKEKNTEKSRVLTLFYMRNPKKLRLDVIQFLCSSFMEIN